MDWYGDRNCSRVDIKTMEMYCGGDFRIWICVFSNEAYVASVAYKLASALNMYRPCCDIRCCHQLAIAKVKLVMRQSSRAKSKA